MATTSWCTWRYGHRPLRNRAKKWSHDAALHRTACSRRNQRRNVHHFSRVRVSHWRVYCLVGLIALFQLCCQLLIGCVQCWLAHLLVQQLFSGLLRKSDRDMHQISELLANRMQKKAFGPDNLTPISTLLAAFKLVHDSNIIRKRAAMGMLSTSCTCSHPSYQFQVYISKSRRPPINWKACFLHRNETYATFFKYTKLAS